MHQQETRHQKRSEFKPDLSMRAEKCALQILRRALLVRQTSTTSNAMFSPSRSQSSHSTSHWQCRASSSKVFFRSAFSCIPMQQYHYISYLSQRTFRIGLLCRHKYQFKKCSGPSHSYRNLSISNFSLRARTLVAGQPYLT